MIDLLEREHPEYRDRAEMWQRYWDFYVGGEQLRRNASQYLVRRQKEPNDVYSERLARVFYENYLGSCVDWYAATLFRRQPGVSLQSKTESTQKFYSQFLDDCDRRGTSLLEVIRKAFIQALIYRESFVLVDFPKVAEAATNRAAEDALGKSRAYLASYSPRELVNWKVDERGEYEWIVLKTTRSYQEQFDKRDFVQEQRWAVYDRERVRVYVHRNHDVEGRSGAGRAILRAAPPGTGIIAGGPMRAVFETLGVQDVVTKSIGSSNPHAMVRATFDGLQTLMSPRSVAARRGKKVNQLDRGRIRGASSGNSDG